MMTQNQKTNAKGNTTGVDAAKTAEKPDGAWLVIFILLLVFSVAGIYKSIFISADIDESYAVTMGVRLARGDRLFLEMWEPHQLSAVLYAPLVWLYLLFAGPTAEGLVLFLRCAGVIVQAVLAFFLYRRLAKSGAKKTALVAAFFYLSFTPKHIQSPEFTTLFYWAMTGLLLLVTSFFEEERAGRKKALAIGAGLCMSIMVLCYPAAVLVFVFCQILMLGSGKQKERDAWWFGAACVIAGLLFLVGMLARGNFSQALSNIPNVLSDASHKQSVLLLWKEHIVSVVSMLVVTGALMVVVFCARPVLDKKREKTAVFWGVFLLLQAIWMLIQFHTLRQKAYYDYLPLVLQMYVAGLFYAVTIPGKRINGEAAEGEKKESGSGDAAGHKSTFFWAMVPLLSTLCILGLSNLPAAYSMGFLFPFVLYLMPQFAVNVTADASEGWKKKLLMGAAFVFALVFAAQLYAVRIGLVRFSGNQRRTLAEEFFKVNHGPLAGIKLGAEDWKHHDELLHCYVEDRTDADVWLYVGADYFIYQLLLPSQIGTGNTISTPEFSGQLLSYYEQFPERIPTVMVVEHDYVHDYSEYLDREPFASFAKEHFDLEHPTERGSVSIYRAR